jgi:RNA polymerase sigma-70 factor, ECF subfamily
VATDVLEMPALARGETPDGSTQMSERVFLSKLRRKDPTVFEAFVRQHQDRVYEFCVRMVSDREEAFDLTQDIFFSIHQHLDGFRADAKVKTWLFRIAKNHCINRLKYLKRRGRGRSDDFAESNELAITESMGGSARPDDDLTRKAEVSLVHRAIETLDEEQRALVVLRDVEGLSYEEIVEITELAEGTVKSRLHRAREKLAKVLAQFEAAPDAENEGD